MIIFINGSINAGKSTVARLLTTKLPKAVIFEPDSIAHMMPEISIQEKLPTIHALIPEIIRGFVRDGYNVIVPYPISEETYTTLLERLDDLKDSIRTFTLAPKLETVFINRGTRELTEKEQERIRHHYRAGIPTPSFGVTIDNSNEPPEKTVERILNVL